MIHQTTDAKPLLDKIERARAEREAEKADFQQALACSRGIHPHVVRGRCQYCSRKVSL